MRKQLDLIFAGSFFILAIITSLVGGVMIEGIITLNPFPSGAVSTLRIGAMLELVNVVCVIGIAAMLYPYIKRVNNQLGILYVALRVVEAIVCLVPAVIAIQLALMGEHNNILITMRGVYVNTMIPIFFILGALILYPTLFKANLVPTYLFVWGIVGIGGILIANVLPAESNLLMVFALPIILNELYLGGYLIVKGVKNNLHQT